MNPVEDFLALKKEAGWLGGLWSAFKSGITGTAHQATTPLQGVSRMLGQATPAAAVTVGMGVASRGIGKGVQELSERYSKPREYQSMINANPTLKKLDSGQVQMVYNSLRRIAPSFAKDPLIAGSFVRNTMEMAPETGPAIPLQTAKLLAEAQKNLRKQQPSTVRLGPLVQPIKTDTDNSLYRSSRDR